MASDKKPIDVTLAGITTETSCVSRNAESPIVTKVLGSVIELRAEL